MVDERYPGRSVEAKRVTNYAAHVVCSAVRVFYVINERWPLSFAEVREQGLVEAELVGFWLDPINPDDGSLNCAGDVRYTYDRLAALPTISWLELDGRPQFMKLDSRPTTLRELCAKADKNGERPMSYRLNDRDWVIAHGRLAMLRRGLAGFNQGHGRWPANWSELEASGFSGLSTLSCPGPYQLRYRVSNGSPGMQLDDSDGRQVSESLLF